MVFNNLTRRSGGTDTDLSPLVNSDQDLREWHEAELEEIDVGYRGSFHKKDSWALA